MAANPLSPVSRYTQQQYQRVTNRSYHNSPDDMNGDNYQNHFRNVNLSRQSQVSGVSVVSSRRSHTSSQDFSEPPTMVVANGMARTKNESMQVQLIHQRIPQTFEGYQTRSAELTLIKDLLFIFQGIQGTILKRVELGKYEVLSKDFVNPCIKHQALRLCCIGTFYEIIKGFISAPTAGIIMQSFKHGLSQELQEYYRIIALMHQIVSKANVADTPMTEEQGKGDEPSLLTMSVWCWDVKRRFEFLANLVKLCQTEKLRGGELCTALFPYVENGCPVVSSISAGMLSTISKPLYSMICEWVLYGELEDPFNEFFIAANHDCRKENLWHSKYTMREKMLPHFISKSLATMILATGKNINFLRDICQCSAAYEGRDEIEKNLRTTPVQCLFQQNDVTVEECISQAYKTTSSMVLSVLMEQSRLVDHLAALKKYLLLGQGDFIKYLLDLLETELSKPASKVLHHNLTSILESAVRSTNAQFEDEGILSRVDVVLLPSFEKDLGWDIFCLDYKVQGPIGTVLSEDVMHQYNLLFNALWRIKRVEGTLSALWKNQTSLFKLQRILPEIGCVLHRSQLLISEMIHFVHQTQYYIMFEATECAWDQLKLDVAKSKDLDEVISAHKNFLTTISARSLLVESSRDLLDQLRRIFSTVFSINEFLTKFDHSVMSEYSRRVAMKPSSPDQVREAQKTFFKNFVAKAKAEIEGYYTLYQDYVHKFLLELNRHQDLSLQSLSFRLDFNEYYQQNDARLTQPLLYHSRRLSMGNMNTSFSILTASMESSFISSNYSHHPVLEVPEPPMEPRHV